MKNNKKLFLESKNYIAGGVNSPVRAFKSVGGFPLFIVKGKGSKIYDVEGKEYIDYLGSWGPLILGHSNPRVIEAVKKMLESGTGFGTPTEAELKLAKLIKRAVPSVELIRFVNSGTEAVMSAVRLARAFTGRDKIIKFEGCYHGYSDSMLVKAGSSLATFGVHSSPGVPLSLAKHTLNLPYNNSYVFKKLVGKLHNEIACVIVEPVAANMGLVLPKEEFIKTLRELSLKHRIVLIFDEVVTGFRLRFGGISEAYDIKPDLTCFGKIIGGGLPVGAYGGKKEIMSLVSPEGPVYQAGTLSGNPLAMVSGITTLEILKDESIYKKLEEKGRTLEEGIKENLKRLNLRYKFNRIGSMFTLFFTEEEVTDFVSAKKSNTKLYSKYFHGMLKKGIYLPPSQFETCFISVLHSKKDIKRTIENNYRVMRDRHLFCCL